MKFKFCGDNDCQDWILAQIYVCSKLTSIKFKLILKEVVNHILTEKLNFDNTVKLTSDAKLTEDENKGVLAALNFIILSAVKYNTDSDTLSNELQQLGLPKEHSVVLSKTYSENFHEIKDIVKEKSLRFNTLEEYSYEIITTIEDENCTINCPSVIMNVKCREDNNELKSKKFYIQPEKLDDLISDLEEVLQIMESTE